MVGECQLLLTGPMPQCTLTHTVPSGDWCVCVMRRGQLLRPSLMLARTHGTKGSDDSEGASEVSYSPDQHSVSLGSSTDAVTDTSLSHPATPSLEYPMTSELQDLVDDMTVEEYSSFSDHMSANVPHLAHPHRVKCQALTRGGTPCRLNHTAGSLFCRRHTPMNH